MRRHPRRGETPSVERPPTHPCNQLQRKGAWKAATDRARGRTRTHGPPVTGIPMVEVEGPLPNVPPRGARVSPPPALPGGARRGRRLLPRRDGTGPPHPSFDAPAERGSAAHSGGAADTPNKPIRIPWRRRMPRSAGSRAATASGACRPHAAGQTHTCAAGVARVASTGRATPSTSPRGNVNGDATGKAAGKKQENRHDNSK